ncbi:MAG: hypothetical protein WCK10_02440, partial [Candidatus Staskawiczbacteria bacterium]
MKVPAPKLCSDCRMQRRFSWRNEWKLMRKKDIHGKEIFSMFHEEAPVKIMEVSEWYSDSWDPMTYGCDYDFSKSFFQQFKEFMGQVPLMSRNLTRPVNSDYCGNATEPKDCYLSFGISYVENSAHSIWGAKSKDIFDCHIYNESELCYDSVNITKCYKTLYSVDCEGCNEVMFCKNCVGCNNCFGCVNLRNKSYYIFNDAYSKEDYTKKIEEFKITSRINIEGLREKSIKHWIQFPNKFIHGRHNDNVSGDYIFNSKNAKNCWRIVGGENVKYCQNFTLGPAKDCYDHSNFGSGSELIYDSLIVGDEAYNVKFSYQCYPSNSNLQYCLICQNSSNLFGCISLRNKQYCIFNKQYTKEEYELLVPKIIEHMKLTGEYGEFFPMEMSPMAYNESFAFEHFPLTKEEVKKRGLVWRDVVEKQFNISMSSDDIPDDINDVDESITKEVIGCFHKGDCEHECVGAFKISSQELQFYKLLNIPLPRVCQNCRHYNRFVWRNPVKLWNRKCMNPGCTNEFETSYAPDRPDIVYCEQCYQQEVI